MPTGKEGEMLLGHNEPVYKNLCETLEKHKKAIVVTFTGGGKSFLASEYLAESGLHALVVCPKRTICSQWAALNQSVDTMTYSAFAKVPLEDLLRYEAVILDEAHHCGSRVWGARAKELTENTAGVVIGLTADSVRWSDGGKDVAQELFDGHIVKGYSLQEAIEQNIVRPFSYVCTIIGFNRMIQERVERLSNGKLDARLRAKAEHLIARLKLDAEAAASVTDVLRQYMPANPKGIVFTDDIAAIEEARGLMNEAFPEMSCYTIHSKQSKEKNEAQLAAFMQAPTACIISVNMLGEGVHVDGVNFIVMLRRTQSPTVYFQQIGRCTKVGSDGEPVIFDIVGNRCTLRMIEVKKAEFLGLSRRAGEKKGGQFVLSSYLEDGLRVLDEIDELLNQWRPWSVEEDEIIRKFYPSEGLETCSRLSNRTKNSVRDRACFLGIARSNYYWKKEEDDILRKYHPKEGTTVCSRLPGRTRNAIKARLATLGIVAPNNRWTKEEDNILQEYYPIEGLAACSRLPGRTRAATQQRAVNLGLTMSSRWTEEEDNILREQYPIEGMAVCSRLPGRSRNSVMQRVFRLNLTVSSRWTKEEDDILRTHYPKEGVAVCSRIPGRTKEATMSRVSHLGIASRRRRWTKGEDDILRKYYPIEGTAVYSRLPGRTRHGIQKRVVALSLHAEEAQATNRLPSGGKRSG